MATYTTDNLTTTTKAERIIRDVIELKSKYERVTNVLRSDWKKMSDSYEGRFNGVSMPFQSQYFVPKISTAVSVMTPIIIGNFPSWRVVPIGPEDDAAAIAMEKIMKFQADYEIGLYPKVVQWVTQAALFGTSFMYVPWVVRRDAQGKKIFDNIELEVHSIFDVFVNPTVPSIEDLEKRNLPLITRFWMTLDDIESNPLYKDKVTVTVKKDLKESKSRSDMGYGSSDILNMQKFNEDSFLYDDVKKVVVYYCWTKERLVVVARGQDLHLLYDGSNPWGIIPYADFKWEVDPIPGRMYGRGIGHMGQDIQDMYNKLFNQLVDNVRNASNAMYQRRRGARIDPRQLISRPGGFIDVDEIDKDLALIEQKLDFPALLKLMDMVDQQFQYATANTDVAMGVSGADSASEAIIQNRNTMLRIELIKKNFATALQRLGRVVKKQDLNNLTDLKVIRVFNDAAQALQVEKIKRSDLEGEHDIQVEPDESLFVNRDIFRKQLLDFYNLSSQDPESRIKKEELTKEIFRGGVKDIDRFFMNDTEFQAKRERMLENNIGTGAGALEGALQGQKLPAPENGLTPVGQMQQINAQNI